MAGIDIFALVLIGGAIVGVVWVVAGPAVRGKALAARRAAPKGELKEPEPSPFDKPLAELAAAARKKDCEERHAFDMLCIEVLQATTQALSAGDPAQKYVFPKVAGVCSRNAEAIANALNMRQAAIKFFVGSNNRDIIAERLKRDKLI